MPRFKHYNYDQDTMVVINYQEQLQPGTFEYAVHYLIEYKLYLSVFHPKYRNDGTGRLAYDPAILLKIILFGYSKGIISSREIQWCCETHIIAKVSTAFGSTDSSEYVSVGSMLVWKSFLSRWLLAANSGSL